MELSCLREAEPGRQAGGGRRRAPRIMQTWSEEWAFDSEGEEGPLRADAQWRHDLVTAGREVGV